MWCLLNSWTFVALKLGCGKARGGRIPAVGCNRRATQPQPNFSATQRAAALFPADFVAHSLQIPLRICSSFAPSLREKLLAAKAYGFRGHHTGTLNKEAQDAVTGRRISNIGRELSTPFHKYDHVCCVAFRFWLGATREHPPQWGCDRGATKPEPKSDATLWATVFLARTSLLAPYRPLKGMRVARASSGPKIPRRKRGCIYEKEYLGRYRLATAKRK